MAQFIYNMYKVRKSHGDKVILDDVTLSFLPGAKIGVVGPNGAGKSSVLKIMAGLDQPSNGDATLAPGSTVGLLQQEPPLDESKTVRENVEAAVADLRAALARFEEVSAAMGEPDADFDALLAEQGELMEKIEHAEGWELDSRIEQAMDALRCPPGDEPVTHLSGGERRRVALCKLLLEQPAAAARQPIRRPTATRDFTDFLSTRAEWTAARSQRRGPEPRICPSWGAALADRCGRDLTGGERLDGRLRVKHPVQARGHGAVAGEHEGQSQRGDPGPRPRHGRHCLTAPAPLYAPALYEVEYREDGQLAATRPRFPDVPARVTKRVVQDLDTLPYPTKPVVPFMQAVHDRISLELFRGCTRGCKFCQAGMITRPVRERSLEKLVDLAEEMVANTGCDEISLVSLSTADYTRLPELTPTPSGDAAVPAGPDGHRVGARVGGPVRTEVLRVSPGPGLPRRHRGDSHLGEPHRRQASVGARRRLGGGVRPPRP